MTDFKAAFDNSTAVYESTCIVKWLEHLVLEEEEPSIRWWYSTNGDYNSTAWNAAKNFKFVPFDNPVAHIVTALQNWNGNETDPTLTGVLDKESPESVAFAVKSLVIET